MRSSIIHDRQFSFSLQTIKLCKDLMKQEEYALSHQLIDDATLLHAWVDKPKAKKADLTKQLAALSSNMEKTRSQLMEKGEYSDYAREAKKMLDRLTV